MGQISDYVETWEEWFINLYISTELKSEQM